MTTNLTSPPAYVWDRIEKILDEQDCEKRQTEKLLLNAVSDSKKMNINTPFFTLITGLGLLALITRKYYQYI